MSRPRVIKNFGRMRLSKILRCIKDRNFLRSHPAPFSKREAGRKRRAERLFELKQRKEVCDGNVDR